MAIISSPKGGGGDPQRTTAVADVAMNGVLCFGGRVWEAEPIAKIDRPVHSQKVTSEGNRHSGSDFQCQSQFFFGREQARLFGFSTN